MGTAGCLACPGEWGDNDPCSCLGSRSVVSAKTPIRLLQHLVSVLARRGYLAGNNFLPKKEGPAVRLVPAGF